MFSSLSVSDSEKNMYLRDLGETNEYLDILAALVEESRFNDYYPNSADLLNSLEILMPATHLGLYEQLEIHKASGLPTYKEFVRVSTDLAHAPRELPSLKQWNGKGNQVPIWDKLQKKKDYYTNLSTRGNSISEQHSIYFRKIHPESSMALFKTVLDRITVAGTLERLTVEFRQHDSLWGKSELSLEEHDVGQMSSNLKGLIYRLATLDVDLIFIRLNDQPNLQVESVTKGIIGPCLFNGVHPSLLDKSFVRVYDDGMLLTASLHRTGVDQPEDVFNDPFYRKTQLSKTARDEFCKNKQTEMFHVLADRKFCLCGANETTLRTYLESVGTNNIIYSI